MPDGNFPEMRLRLFNHGLQRRNQAFPHFLRCSQGEEETRSLFDVAGPLSQVFNLGVLAQQLNTKIVFDRDKKQITNNKLANELLVGTPPRKGWEQFYKM